MSIATNSLMQWIKGHPGLIQKLQKTMSKPRRKMLTPLQVSMIIKYLGEPKKNNPQIIDSAFLMWYLELNIPVMSVIQHHLDFTNTPVAYSFVSTKREKFLWVINS